jgi:glutamate/tyrosine decarboxylase-like PLP-dependent enzyme
MFFARHGRVMDALFDVHTSYVPETDQGTHDAYRRTLQWSRRFIGLKVYMTLAELGGRGVAALVDRQAAMADLLREGLSAEGWTIANDTPLPLVCFTRQGLGADDVSALVRTIVAEGAVWVSEVRLPDGARWLRACVTHHEVAPPDVRALVQAVCRAAAHVIAP